MTAGEALERAREAARGDGELRYVYVVAGEWASPETRVDLTEPGCSHVRVEPGGALVGVFLPTDDS